MFLNLLNHSVIGEFGICLWLLMRGVANTPERKPVLEPAEA